MMHVFHPSTCSAAGARTQLAAHAVSSVMASTSRTFQRTLATEAAMERATIPAQCGRPPKATWIWSALASNTSCLCLRDKALQVRACLLILSACWKLASQAAGYGNAIILTGVAVGTPELVMQTMLGQPVSAGRMPEACVHLLYG